MGLSTNSTITTYTDDGSEIVVSYSSNSYREKPIVVTVQLISPSGETVSVELDSLQMFSDLLLRCRKQLNLAIVETNMISDPECDEDEDEEEEE